MLITEKQTNNLGGTQRKTFAKFSELASPTLGEINTMSYSRHNVLKTDHLFSGTTVECVTILITTKATGKFELKNSLQNNCPVLFKNVKVKQYKSGLKGGS